MSKLLSETESRINPLEGLRRKTESYGRTTKIPAHGPAHACHWTRVRRHGERSPFPRPKNQATSTTARSPDSHQRSRPRRQSRHPFKAQAHKCSPAQFRLPQPEPHRPDKPQHHGTAPAKTASPPHLRWPEHVAQSRRRHSSPSTTVVCPMHSLWAKRTESKM